MNPLSGPCGGPVRSLRILVASVALLMSACASTGVPAHLGNKPPPPRPGLATLHRAALEQPTSPEPHISLANLYLELENYTLAEDEARTAVALAPASAPAHAALAGVLYQQPIEGRDRVPRSEEALAEIERALELKPGEPAYELLAATIALDLGELDKAGRLLGDLVVREPQNSQVVFNLARLTARRHQYPEAGELFERAAKLAGDPRLRTYVAWSIFMAGDEAGALSRYDAIPEEHFDSGDRLVLAILALRRSAFPEAEAQIRARYVRPDDASELMGHLDLVARVKDGRLKANAVADLLEARLALEIEDQDKAELLLRRAIEVDRRLPEAPEALAELLLFVRRDARQALKVLSDAPAQTANYRRFHLFIQNYRALQDAIGAQEVLREFLEFVATDVEQGQRAEARQGLETMVLLLPVPSLWQFLVDLAVEEEDLPGLLASWDRLTATVPKLDAHFTAITGEGLIRLGRYEQAERLLRQALIKHPTHYGLLANLGLLGERRGELETSEEAYRRLTIIHPDMAAAWILLGRHYLARDMAEEARDAFEEALRREDDPPEGLSGLVQALSRLELHDEAIEAARRLTMGRPEDPQSWTTLARAAGEAGLYGEQEQALRQAILRGQEHAASWNSLAWFLCNVPEFRLRRVDEAVVAARRAVDLSGGTVPTYLDTLAEALYQAGKLNEALRTIEQAIVLQPEFDYYHRQRRKIRNALESASPAHALP